MTSGRVGQFLPASTFESRPPEKISASDAVNITGFVRHLTGGILQLLMDHELNLTFFSPDARRMIKSLSRVDIDICIFGV